MVVVGMQKRISTMPRGIYFGLSVLIIATLGVGLLESDGSDPFHLLGHGPTHTEANQSGFITGAHGTLQLNGKPFRFAGANMHWLPFGDSTNYSSQFQINDGLDTAKAMGLTVIRAHDLGISTGCHNCIEPALGVFNKIALQHDDYVITAAAKRGLHLIIPLTDNFHHPAGGKHNFTDWRGIADENQFYSNPQVISDFETYISVLLNHVNSYTGIAYRDDPTILAWETGNALTPPTSWTQTVSTYIKSIDYHHLIVDGRYDIDPQATRLSTIDIVSTHFYPKNISHLTEDATIAKKMGKAFIVGEFDWNDANGGDTLQSFLTAIMSNSAIAGDAFWELWPHDDQYGYIHQEAKYDLHYPGDALAMQASVQLLRSHAYKMRGLALPPDSIPGTPLLETVIRNGTSNVLIWRGTPATANYTVERSIIGADGPWSVLCNRCATDNNTPWVDTQIPKASLWYRVIAYNASGMAGPPSSAFQAGSTGFRIDNLNDWSGVYQHSPNLGFDTTNAQFMCSDTSRVLRTTATHEFVTWRQKNMLSFQAIAYFWSYEPVSPLSFYTSADGQSWTAATPTVVAIHGDWQEDIYTLQKLANVNYVKVVWNNTTGQPWNPNLGTVSILF